MSDRKGQLKRDMIAAQQQRDRALEARDVALTDASALRRERDAWKARALRLERERPWSLRAQAAVMDWLADMDDRVRRAVGL